MKKIAYILLAATLFIVTSCGEEFLDTKNLTQTDISKFFKSKDDIDVAIAGVYSAMYVGSAQSEESIAAGLLSDQMFGGGGPDDMAAKAADNFQDPNEDTYRDLWVSSYKGIQRANAIIENIDQAVYENEAEKQEAIGESYFLRAYFYFRIAKFFGGVPLLTSVFDAPNQPRADIKEVYGQIAFDLKKAIELMGSTSYVNIPSARLGHATKWTAEAYMARVYLFYTGYMTNTLKQATSEIQLPDGGVLTKAEVITWLKDCIDNSGHQLASDFRNLWPYSYTGSASTGNYSYAKDNNLAWVGEDGPIGVHGTGNLETMFMTRYAGGVWEHDKVPSTQLVTNRYCLYFGIRDNSLVPFGQGWGWGTINPQLWDAWDDADPRKVGSIINLKNGTELAGYKADKGDQETGYINKKYTSIQYDNGGGSNKGMFFYLYGGQDDMQLWQMQDFILMRFADVLLMASELTEDASYLNRVRTRAGLGTVAYSLENVKAERRWELAFEGLRWFDLLRWGDTQAAFSVVKDIPVRNSGKEAIYSSTYRPETKGLLPIPEGEIRLSNGVLTQNEGW